jgi:hypothetical protein
MKILRETFLIADFSTPQVTGKCILIEICVITNYKSATFIFCQRFL